MTDENECYPDPESMTHEERLELIEALHTANHKLIDQAGDIAESLGSMSRGIMILGRGALKALEGDEITRRVALEVLAFKLDFLGAQGLAYLGVTEEDYEREEAFAQIVEGIDLQMPTEEEEGTDE